MASRLASTLARNAYRSARAGQGTLAARPNALAGASALAVSAPRRHAAGGRPRTAKGTQSGFSYPGPKALDKIVKVQLLQKHGTPRVREIWEEYHKDHKTAVGDSLTKDEFGTLMQRTKRCPVFVLPVPR